MMQNSQVIQKATVRIGDFLSHSKPTKLLAVLIIFFSATQFGLHLWPLSSLVYGIRVDYLSPTVYFLDILILCYLLLQIKNNSSLSKVWNHIGNLLPIGLIILIYSSNTLSSFAWLIHFLLYVLFIFSFNLKLLPKILPLAVFVQVLLALAQTFLGHSLGGIMYYLGERNVSVGSPNIALATFMDKVILRAYGTFSHPNILAGWLVVALIILLIYSQELKLKIIYTPTVIIGVLLTGSRAALITLFAIVIPFFVVKKNPRILVPYFALLLSLFIYFTTTGAPARAELSRSERQTLQTTSLSIIQRYPIFGTGVNASISTYPTISPSLRLLQPDHNSLTLLLSWLGVFGVIAMIFAVSHSGISIPSLLFLAPLIVLDHYFLTSPQGLFCFLLYLRLVGLKYRYAQKNRQ